MQKLDLTDEERHQRHLEQMREWRRKNRKRQTHLTLIWRAENPERAKEINDKFNEKRKKTRREIDAIGRKKHKAAQIALEEQERTYKEV